MTTDTNPKTVWTVSETDDSGISSPIGIRSTKELAIALVVKRAKWVVAHDGELTEAEVLEQLEGQFATFEVEDGYVRWANGFYTTEIEAFEMPVDVDEDWGDLDNQ
jgi:hypothetical protein